MYHFIHVIDQIVAKEPDGVNSKNPNDFEEMVTENKFFENHQRYTETGESLTKKCLKRGNSAFKES